MGLFDEWFSDSDATDPGVIANVSDGSNDYFGLTNAAPAPTSDDGGSIHSWLDAISSGAKALSGTASTVAKAYTGVDALLNPAQAEAAAAAQNTGHVSIGAGAGNSNLLLILGAAAGAYFLLR